MNENDIHDRRSRGERSGSSVEQAAERIAAAPDSLLRADASAGEQLKVDRTTARVSLIERSTLARGFGTEPSADAIGEPAAPRQTPAAAPPSPAAPVAPDRNGASVRTDRHAESPGSPPDTLPPPPQMPAHVDAVDRAPPGADQTPARRRRGFFGALWSIFRFLLIGRKRETPKARKVRKEAEARVVVKPRRGVFGRGSRSAAPPPPPQAVRPPGSVHRSGASASAEAAVAQRDLGAATQIRRPLDLTRRVGSTVHIDLERAREIGLVTPVGERTQIAEEFRLIKRPLLLNSFEKGPNAIRNGNVIMVASSRSGEGKTFTAINLAMSIASERDLTVLLIDADVAKPDIPNVLGFERDVDLGLVDLIADEQVKLSDVILRTNIDNLSIIPAGRPHHLATELLASERMAHLVTELSLRYPERVVVMDSPPALLSSVAGVLALHVGQILFVVEADRTTQTAVDSAIGLVNACKNINLLLNKTKPLGSGERFGSYNSYYYR